MLSTVNINDRSTTVDQVYIGDQFTRHRCPKTTQSTTEHRATRADIFYFIYLFKFTVAQSISQDTETNDVNQIERRQGIALTDASLIRQYPLCCYPRSSEMQQQGSPVKCANQRNAGDQDLQIFFKFGRKKVHLSLNGLIFDNLKPQVYNAAPEHRSQSIVGHVMLSNLY